jgi:hypothetical protein
MNQRLITMMAIAGACLQLGCLKANLDGGMLACSTSGKCPAPYRCVEDLCVGVSDGGAAPADGAPIAGSVLDTFDTDRESFIINTWPNPLTRNLGSLSPDPVMFGWDPVEGDPQAGSLKVTIPFTDYNQEVEVTKWLTPTQDWTGKTLHAWVRIASGGTPAGALKVSLVLLCAIGDADASTNTVQSASKYFMAKPTTDWQEFVMGPYDVDVDVVYDPAWNPMTVTQVGVFVGTPTPNPVPAAKPTTAVVYIDSLSLSDGP